MANPNWPGTALAGSPEAGATWRLGPVRLGYIEYLNCLPVYYGIEQGIIDLPVAVKKGPPAQLNQLFLQGALDITPISSIEYARHAADTVILPDLSISADGRVTSVLLFSKVPLSELQGRPVALTSHSATSVVLTKIILQERYGVKPAYFTAQPDPYDMLNRADACLIIGDNALLAAYDRNLKEQFPTLQVVDLGEAFYELTGQIMVFALWVIRREFAARNPDGVRLVANLFRASQDYAMAHMPELVEEALLRRNLPREAVEDHFRQIRHHFTAPYKRGLQTYFELAYKIGEIPAVPELHVWGE
ncbi:MAG TPA: menaquinone biosynthesis protein [Symbiobacteriaceae bacterium]|nr:menaquinone biosynthesis protein [Symbiobacteriaceae bacterium]